MIPIPNILVRNSDLGLNTGQRFMTWILDQPVKQILIVFLRRTYEFNHLSFLHWRDPATDDAGAEAAQLDEVVSEGMIQSPRQTVTVHNKLEFLLTESEKSKKDLDQFPGLFLCMFFVTPAALPEGPELGSMCTQFTL